MHDYCSKSLTEIYAEHINPDDIIYVGSDLRWLGLCDLEKPSEILNSHVTALKSALGRNGVAVFPSASLNLCNNDEVFCLDKTPSYQMGVLPEFVRSKGEGHRSFHPLWSHYAIGGARSKEIVENISSNAHGQNSVWSRLCEQNGRWVSIGHHPRNNLAIIHYLECMSDVSYRMVKSFRKKFFLNGMLSEEEFQIFVLRHNQVKFKRDKNRYIFELVRDELEIKKSLLGKGAVYSFNISKFCELALSHFKINQFLWFGRTGIPEEMRALL